MPGDILDGNDGDANAVLRLRRQTGLTLLNLRNKTIAKAGKSLNEPGMLRLLLQGDAYLTDAEVEILLEVDECILAPDGVLNLLARHRFALMVHQKRQNARRLLLHPEQRTVPAQLKSLLVELKFSKSNDRHGEGREVTLDSRNYSI